jgi:hypothetical protein
VSGFIQATRAEVERPKTKACQPRDEGKNPIHSVRYPFCEDERVNACDCPLPPENRQGARGMMRCSQRPKLVDGYHT